MGGEEAKMAVPLEGNTQETEDDTPDVFPQPGQDSCVPKSVSSTKNISEKAPVGENDASAQYSATQHVSESFSETVTEEQASRTRLTRAEKRELRLQNQKERKEKVGGQKKNSSKQKSKAKDRKLTEFQTFELDLIQLFREDAIWKSPEVDQIFEEIIASISSFNKDDDSMEEGDSDKGTLSRHFQPHQEEIANYTRHFQPHQEVLQIASAAQDEKTEATTESTTNENVGFTTNENPVVAQRVVRMWAIRERLLELVKTSGFIKAVKGPFFRGGFPNEEGGDMECKRKNRGFELGGFSIVEFQDFAFTLWSMPPPGCHFELHDLGVTHMFSCLSAHDANLQTLQELSTTAGINWNHVNLPNATPQSTLKNAERIKGVKQDAIQKVEKWIADSKESDGQQSEIQSDEGKTKVCFLIHCLAGMHRTGFVSWSCLRKLGFSPRQTFAAIALARPDTASQCGTHRLMLAESGVVQT